MKSLQLLREHQRLQSLLKNTTIAANLDPEIQSHWAQYLCVRAAGFMENALGALYSDYARKCSSASVANYVTASLSAIHNPKAQRFLETARKFDPRWADDLERFMDEDGRRDALDSIMTNRHLIAHGQDSGITIVRVKDYLEKCIQVVEYIERQCGTAGAGGSTAQQAVQ